MTYRLLGNIQIQRTIAMSECSLTYERTSRVNNNRHLSNFTGYTNETSLAKVAARWRHYFRFLYPNQGSQKEKSP
jgi:hypothetical protein